MARGFAALLVADASGLPLTDDLAEAEWLVAIWTPAGLTAAAPGDFTGADELLALAGPCAGGMGLVSFAGRTGGGVRFRSRGVKGS